MYNSDNECFYASLFRPDDWVEVKRSKPAGFIEQLGFRASEIVDAIPHLSEGYNVWTGVCPRLTDLTGTRRWDDETRPYSWGCSSRIPLARSLWADLDHCPPDEAVARVEAAKLPAASFVVSSGGGSHLYWILTAPAIFEIDWERRRLSAAAIAVEDANSWIAEKIGGDSTHDLARVLRVPGTENHKYAPTVSCRLVQCHPERTYDLDLFKPPATAKGRKKRRSGGGYGLELSELPGGLIEIADLTPRQRDALEAAIERSATAEIGTRSEIDFALLCWAVKIEVDPSDLWKRIENVGKFSEGQERYFCRTWVQAFNTVDAEIEAENEKAFCGKVSYSLRANGS